jgi:hypothetical protein
MRDRARETLALGPVRYARAKSGAVQRAYISATATPLSNP